MDEEKRKRWRVSGDRQTGRASCHITHAQGVYTIVFLFVYCGSLTMPYLPEGSFEDSPPNKACLDVPEQSKAIPLTRVHSNGTSCRENSKQTPNELAAVYFLQASQTLVSRQKQLAIPGVLANIHRTG